MLSIVKRLVVINWYFNLYILELVFCFFICDDYIIVLVVVVWFWF